MSAHEHGEVKFHAWHVNGREYLRHYTRRGKVHAFETIDPKQTALVVVDMIPFFVSENPYCRGIVPYINLLADSLCAVGGTVAWILPALESRVSELKKEFYGPKIAKT